MTPTTDSALKIVEYLLQIKAIKLQPQQPFTWASGIKSPIYCDNRLILSYPKIRTFFRQEMTRLIDHQFAKPDVIAGVATAGIPLGVLVAQDLGLPFVYVRSNAKEHGLKNNIEGHIESGQQVVVVEDLISTGGSSLKAVESIRAAQAIVKGMVGIFTYGLPISIENFKQAKCELHTLANYDILLQQAAATGYIKRHEIKMLEEWKNNPEEWGKKYA